MLEGLILGHLFSIGAYLGFPSKNWASNTLAMYGFRGRYAVINLHYTLFYVKHFLYVNQQTTNRVFSTTAWIAAHRVEIPKKYLEFLVEYEKYFFICSWWLYGLVSNPFFVTWSVFIEPALRSKMKKLVYGWIEGLDKTLNHAKKGLIAIKQLSASMFNCKKYLYFIDKVIYKKTIGFPRTVFVVNYSESSDIHNEGVSFKTPVYAAVSTWKGHNYLYVPSNDYLQDTSKFFLTTIKNHFYKNIMVYREHYLDRILKKYMIKFAVV